MYTLWKQGFSVILQLIKSLLTVAVFWKIKFDLFKWDLFVSKIWDIFSEIHILRGTSNEGGICLTTSITFL